MPVRLRRGLKRPSHGMPTQAVANVRVFRDVPVVVKIEKRSARDRVVQRNGRKNDEQTEDQVLLLRGLEQGRLRRAMVWFLACRRHCCNLSTASHSASPGPRSDLYFRNLAPPRVTGPERCGMFIIFCGISGGHRSPRARKLWLRLKSLAWKRDM